MVNITAHHRAKAAAAFANRNPPTLEIDPATLKRHAALTPPPQVDPWWQHPAANALSMARVLSSPPVLEHVYAAHMATCRACPHSSPGKPRAVWLRAVDAGVFAIAHSLATILGSLRRGGFPLCVRPSLGALFCRACPCPESAAADLNVKNRYSAHECPDDPPRWPRLRNI